MIFAFVVLLLNKTKNIFSPMKFLCFFVWMSDYKLQVVAFYKEEVRSEILGFYANTMQNFIP